MLTKIIMTNIFYHILHSGSDPGEDHADHDNQIHHTLHTGYDPGDDHDDYDDYDDHNHQ